MCADVRACVLQLQDVHAGMRVCVCVTAAGRAEVRACVHVDMRVC